MAKFKNISPLGDLDLPLVGRVVKAGEVITVSAAQAKHLEGQDATWKPIAPRQGTRDPEPPAGQQEPAQAVTDEQGAGED